MHGSKEESGDLEHHVVEGPQASVDVESEEDDRYPELEDDHNSSRESLGKSNNEFKKPENFDIPQDYIQEIVPKKSIILYQVITLNSLILYVFIVGSVDVSQQSPGFQEELHR